MNEIGLLLKKETFVCSLERSHIFFVWKIHSHWPYLIGELSVTHHCFFFQKNRVSVFWKSVIEGK